VSRTDAGPLIVLTRIWPTVDRPSLGIFVRERVRGLARVVVVHPGEPAGSPPVLYARMLWRALRVSGPIGVEAHVVAPTGAVGWLVARLRRVPLVVYAHGGDVREWRSRPWPIRWLTPRILRAADRVVTNSEESARHIRDLGVDLIIVPPGVDIGRFRPRPRPAVRRVLYLGGRSERKGYRVAEALADTLVGPGLREVDPSDVPELIAEHDVVLVPSVAEPFGLVAVEAIASGRWVVANDVGGLRDIVTDGVNGTLVRDGDYGSALAEVPDYDPESIARTVERYSLERWQRRMDEIWSDLAPGWSAD
jgi:glycosyltransferase involved in cell wall biosynthesis